MLRDFERVHVRDEAGKAIPLQARPQFPPGPIVPVSLTLPYPHAATQLKRKLSNGIPAPMRSVTFIELTGTPATEGDIAWLAERLPWCEIRWDNGVVWPRE
jgi:hypothetical protein